MQQYYVKAVYVFERLWQPLGRTATVNKQGPGLYQCLPFATYAHNGSCPPLPATSEQTPCQRHGRYHLHLGILQCPHLTPGFQMLYCSVKPGICLPLRPQFSQCCSLKLYPGHEDQLQCMLREVRTPSEVWCGFVSCSCMNATTLRPALVYTCRPVRQLLYLSLRNICSCSCKTLARARSSSCTNVYRLKYVDTKAGMAVSCETEELSALRPMSACRAGVCRRQARQSLLDCPQLRCLA